MAAPTTEFSTRASAFGSVGTILGVTAIGYAFAPTRHPLHGEETCRALHGIEMAETGDWLIATNQLVPILDRPPLQYWLFAFVHRFVHELDPLTLRVSAALIVACSALLAWWYARRFVSEPAARIAGVAFPTLGHVSGIGRLAEADALFALLAAASLASWHAGWTRERSSAMRTWILASALAALATLTKGLQGAIVFYGSVWIWLTIRGEYRALFTRGHVAGITVFAALIAIWQVPFWFEAGWEGTRSTWLEPFTSRINDDRSTWEGLVRLVRFPFEVFGALLPWAALLVLLAFRPLRTLDARRRSCATFTLTVIAVVFAPIWFSGGGLGRYAMPLYPMLTVLVALLVEFAVKSGGRAARIWTGYARFVAGAFTVAILVLSVATVLTELSEARSWARLAQPWWLLILLAVAALVLVPKTWRLAGSRRIIDAAHTGTLCAVLLAAAFGGPAVNVQTHEVVRVEPQVAALRDTLPEHATLYSLDPVHHRFLYWYGAHLPIVPWPESTAELPDDFEYFAISKWERKPVRELPFAWDEIARINLDRRSQPEPVVEVIVGRRR